MSKLLVCVPVAREDKCLSSLIGNLVAVNMASPYGPDVEIAFIMDKAEPCEEIEKEVDRLGSLESKNYCFHKTTIVDAEMPEEYKGKSGAFARCVQLAKERANDFIILDTDCAVLHRHSFLILYHEWAEKRMPICGPICFDPKNAKSSGVGMFIHGCSVYHRDITDIFPELLYPSEDPTIQFRQKFLMLSSPTSRQSRMGDNWLKTEGYKKTITDRGIVLEHPDKEGKLWRDFLGA